MDLSIGLALHLRGEIASGGFATESHRGNDMTASGATSTTSSIGGGLAFNFNGAAHVILTAAGFPAAVAVDSVPGHGQTIQAWLKATADISHQSIIQKTSSTVSATIDGWGLRIAGPSGAKVASYYYGTLPADPNDKKFNNSTSTITTGSWDHILCVHEQGFGHYTYLNADDDGNPNMSTTDPGDHNDSSAQLFDIGQKFSGTEPFTGDITEIAVWNTSHSRAVAHWLYNNGNGRQYGDLRGNRGRERNSRSRNAA